MGLYDNYKLDNSTYISQYVGSVVPELKDFSQVMQKRYNEARDTDDSLTEALGNLQHLGLEADTQYANELKQRTLNGLLDRSGRDDYENMGRRTKRDALKFSKDYMPLIQRQKDLSTELQRVQMDDKIFSSDTKSQIQSRISYLNDQRRGENGDFARDQNGNIKLGAVQGWAYAKDVDINKKLADFLKEKATDVNQGGFSANGTGLMVSNKTETRSAAEMARLAAQMMDSDPEIKAMIERDVDLRTYRLTPGQMTEQANKENISIYDKLRRQGLSDTMIRSNLKANGLSVEVAKLKPVDVLRDRYASAGRNPQDADADFVRDQVRKGLMSPHMQLIGDLLKVDKNTIEARSDGMFLARAIGAAMSAANSGDASPLIVTPDNAESSIDAASIHNTAVENIQKADEMKGHLQAAVGESLGLPKPQGKQTADWFNQTGKYLNDRKAQGDLIQKLAAEGKSQEANNLTQAFRAYNDITNKAVYAKQQRDTFAKEVDFKPIYQEYLKNEKGPKMSEAQLKSVVLDNTKINHREFMGAEDYTREQDGFVNRLLGRDEDYAKRIARGSFFKAMQQKATAYGKTGQTANTTIEPTGSGYLKNQTDFVENGLRSGDVRGTDMATGESFQDIIRKELGKGWFSTSISEKDKRNPTSDYNKAMDQLKVRINLDTRGANGQPTATVTTPSGQKRTIVLDNISPNLPTEMAARMMDASGKYMTRSEATNHMQSAATGAGYSVLNHVNQADLYNMRPAAQPYQLTDDFFLKVQEAGKKGVGNKTNVYTLMVKQGGKFVPTKVANRTDLKDIILALGGREMQQQMTTSPSTNILER